MADYSINFQAKVDVTHTQVFRGSVLSRSSDGFYVKNTAALRAAGFTPTCVAISNSTVDAGVILTKEGGEIDADIAGIGVGAAWPVIVNALGNMERKQTPTADDYVIGQADPLGNVLLRWPEPRVM